VERETNAIEHFPHFPHFPNGSLGNKFELPDNKRLKTKSDPPLPTKNQKREALPARDRSQPPAPTP